MKDKILVLITTGTEEEAARIARSLVEERLIACANVVGGVRSLYRWKGEVCDDREILLLCKTQRSLFPQVSEKVRSIHSYEVPEIIALPIVEGWPAYLDWVERETTPV